MGWGDVSNFDDSLYFGDALTCDEASVSGDAFRSGKAWNCEEADSAAVNDVETNCAETWLTSFDIGWSHCEWSCELSPDS